jgi:hypothetical protein
MFHCPKIRKECDQGFFILKITYPDNLFYFACAGDVFDINYKTNGYE